MQWNQIFWAPSNDDGAPGLSADDLSLLSGDDAGDDGDENAEAGDKGASEQTGEKGKAGDQGKAPAAAGEADPAKGKTIAGGEETKEKEPEAKKPYWPEDWRQKLAEHLSAGDKKIYAKELRRLERITDPAGIYGMYREAESRLTSGGLIKVPGKDAKPEEVAEYHKALGVPEKPEDYLKAMTLENGAVIGEADKPLLDGVLAAMHKSGAPPAAVNAMVNWYYAEQEKQAADLDEADDAFRREAEQALKEEFGASFKRSVNAIAPLFATAPGGTDISNDQSLYARLMGGRTADGRVIGNDPDMVRFLIGLAREVNPAATLTEDGDQSGKSIDDELADIQKLRTTEPKRYWSASVQARELELITAQQKLRARA
jgi:hypothetical protein